MINPILLCFFILGNKSKKLILFTMSYFYLLIFLFVCNFCKGSNYTILNSCYF